MLDAVRYHTVGSPDWDDVGAMLYLADFLEPGRDNDPERERLSRWVPTQRDAVLREVVRRRIDWVLRSGWPLPEATVAFWNKIAAEP